MASRASFSRSTRITPRFSTGPAFPSLTAIGKPVDLAVVCAPPAACRRFSTKCASGRVAPSFFPVRRRPSPLTFSAGAARSPARAQRSRIRVVGPASFGVIRTSLGLNASYSAVAAAPGRLSADLAIGRGLRRAARFRAHRGHGIRVGRSTRRDRRRRFRRSAGVRAGRCRNRRHRSVYRNASRCAELCVGLARRRTHQAGDRAQGGTASAPHRCRLGDARPGPRVRNRAQRAGTVRVHTYAQLFASARVLASGRIPRSNRLAIVTNGRGPGLLAIDRAAETDVVLADLSAATRGALAALLPPEADPGNPVDVRGEATPARFGAAVTCSACRSGRRCGAGPACPGAGRAAGRHRRSRRRRRAHCGQAGARGMAGRVDRPDARVALESGGIANFFTPEIAVDAFASVAAYRRNQEWLLEVPPPQPALSAPDLAAAERVHALAIAANRSRLADSETAALLSAFGIPAGPLAAVSTVATARAFARRVGYPVVALERDGDAGPVRAGLRDGRTLERAWAELCCRQSAPGARQRAVHRAQAARIRAVVERCASPCAPIRCSGRSSATGATSAQARELALMLPPLNRRLAVDLIAGARHAGASPDVFSRWSHCCSNCQPCSARCPGSSRWSSTRSRQPDRRGRRACQRQRRPFAHPALPDGYRHMAIHPYPVELETSLHLRSGEVLKLGAADTAGGCRPRARVRRRHVRAEPLSPLHAAPAGADAANAGSLHAGRLRPRARADRARRGSVAEASSAVARYVGNPRPGERGVRDRGRRRLARARARPRDDAGADRVRDQARLQSSRRRRAREQRADAGPGQLGFAVSAIPKIASRWS